MVIDSNTSLNTGNTSTRNTQNRTEPVATPTETAGAADRSTSSDSVSLSPQAQSIVRLESAVASAPDVDTARVSELRAAIESGQYQVDPEQVANSILSQDNLS